MLPNDVARCFGVDCEKRLQCARYRCPNKPFLDKGPGWFSYVGRVCETPEFEMLIPVERSSTGG